MGDRDGAYGIATCGCVLITVWRRPATVERIREVRRREQTLLDGSPGGIAALTVMEPSSISASVGAAERAEAAAIARHFAQHTRAVATAIEGSGFLQSVARSVLAGVNLVV